MSKDDSWVRPPLERALREITRLDDSTRALEKHPVQPSKGKPKIPSQDTRIAGGWRSWGKGSGFKLVLSHRERVKDKLPGGSEACC